MFNLKIFQALHGDCLLLEYGTEDTPAYILIDGGPGKVYQEHLREELLGLRDKGNALRLVVLSHVDDDHVNGLLDLLNELVDQRREGKHETIEIKGLWHNSFNKTLGNTVSKNLTRQMEASPLPRSAMPFADMQERSIRQGHELTVLARGLNIPINVEFRETPDRLVCVDNINESIGFDNLRLRIVGPTRGTLQALQAKWEKWLAKQKKAAEEDSEFSARAFDKSVPNLSSIMLLVEGDGKTVLLTGDGRGDHLLEGMEQAGVLNNDGTLHVDVFKLPHHGSNRNVTVELFERITAETYVICADGKHDNPDFQTLEWLVQTAMQQGRSIQIIATSKTESTQTLVEKYDPEQSGYKLTYIEAGAHHITLEL